MADDSLFDTPGVNRDGELSLADSGFEDLIRETPEDPEAFLVYGDYLTSQGDVRGELCTVQYARHHRPDDPDLWEAERRLLEAHRDHLLGPLAPHRRWLVLRWFCGFLQYAGIDPGEFKGMSTIAMIRWILESPTGAFLRDLAVGQMLPTPSPAGNRGYYDELIDTLVSLGRPLTLRSLVLGNNDPFYLGLPNVGQLWKLWGEFPRLERLVIHGRYADCGGIIPLAELKELSLISSGLSAECLQPVTSSYWRKLERLTLWLGPRSLGCDITLEDLHPILSARGVPHLKHLAIMQSEFSDDLCEAIARSRVVGQLESLGLGMGTMTNLGATALWQRRDAFRNLRFLNVSDNYLQGQGRRLLEGICPHVNFGQQHGPDVNIHDLAPSVSRD